jgi:hypothetical protein
LTTRRSMCRCVDRSEMQFGDRTHFIANSSASSPKTRVEYQLLETQFSDCTHLIAKPLETNDVVSSPKILVELMPYCIFHSTAALALATVRGLVSARRMAVRRLIGRTSHGDRDGRIRWRQWQWRWQGWQDQVAELVARVVHASVACDVRSGGGLRTNTAVKSSFQFARIKMHGISLTCQFVFSCFPITFARLFCPLFTGSSRSPPIRAAAASRASSSGASPTSAFRSNSISPPH